jgi:hypothetical protein
MAGYLCEPLSRWYDSIAGVEMCCNASGSAAAPCSLPPCTTGALAAPGDYAQTNDPNLILPVSVAVMGAVIYLLMRR